MTTDRIVRLSEAFYEMCLRLFPAAHRGEYGALMSQLFRDRLREVRRQNRPWGFLRLWLRTLTDVAINSVREHIYEWRQTLMVTKNKFEFLVRFHVAELACAAVALLVSFLSFRYGMIAFLATTAVATIVATLLATLLDKRWRSAL